MCLQLFERLQSTSPYLNGPDKFLHGHPPSLHRNHVEKQRMKQQDWVHNKALVNAIRNCKFIHLLKVVKNSGEKLIPIVSRIRVVVINFYGEKILKQCLDRPIARLILFFAISMFTPYLTCAIIQRVVECSIIIFISRTSLLWLIKGFSFGNTWLC